MKQIFLSMVLMLVAVFAFAGNLPSAHQIEDALSAGNFGEARQMIEAVKAQYPANARIHLLNAYVLAHADHDKTAASAELTLAEKLDKKGTVKESPLFGRTSAEIDAIKADVPVPNVVASMNPPPPPSEGHFWLWAFFITLAGVAAYYFLRRPSTVLISGSSGRGSYTHVDPVPPSYSPTPSGATYGSYQGGYSSAPSGGTTIINNGGGTGSSALSTGVAVAGGVVAGELIADEIRGSTSRRRQNRDTSNDWRDTPASTSTYTPDVQSTEVRRESFNSGSNNDDWSPAPAARDWDSTPSRSSSWDDSSSSSSSDWGNSSSSDSGGSDWSDS